MVERVAKLKTPEECAVFEKNVAAVSYLIVTGGAIGLSVALAASSEAANSNLPAQTSSARGVTIKVTPKNLANNAGSWEFAIVLVTRAG